MNFEEEEILRKKKEKENLNELSRIIKEENKLKNNNNNLKYIEKINSFRKRSINLTSLTNKKQEFLMESDNNLRIINPFGKNWEDIEKEIKEKSIFRNFETYEIKNFIAKANDDLRQELITMQIIKRFSQIFKEAEIPLKLRPYEILITSPNSGLIEFIPNTISIDGLKKKIQPENSLNVFFRNFFISNFEEAQKNFVESLAAYSILQYTLSLKDRYFLVFLVFFFIIFIIFYLIIFNIKRHNGNILLDISGHIIHIDFGFILGISPGNLGFESAPFKLTQVKYIYLFICLFIY